MKKLAVAVVTALAVLAPVVPAEAASTVSIAAAKQGTSKTDKKVKKVLKESKPVIQKYKKKNDGKVPSQEAGYTLLEEKAPLPKNVLRSYYAVGKKQYCLAAFDIKGMEDLEAKTRVWFYDSKRKETFRASNEKQLRKKPGACLQAHDSIG